MNTKISFTYGLRIVVALAGLAVAAYGGRAALAKPADRLAQAEAAKVVVASTTRLAAEDHAGQKAEIELLAGLPPAQARLAVTPEAQPADDKGGLNAGQGNGGVEASDDRGVVQAEPGDDKGQGEIEAGEDTGQDEAEIGDDKGVREIEPGDDKGMGEVESSDDKSTGSTGDDAGRLANEVEISGAVGAVNGNVLTINGMTLTLSAATEIKGTLKVGDVVKVEALRQSDNTIAVRQVTIIPQKADDTTLSQPSSPSTDDGQGFTTSNSSGGGSRLNDSVAKDNHGGKSGNDDSNDHH